MVEKFYDYCDGEMREVDTDEVSNCRVWVRYNDYAALEAQLVEALRSQTPGVDHES